MVDSEGRHSSVCFNKSSRWFWFSITFENTNLEHLEYQLVASQTEMLKGDPEKTSRMNPWEEKSKSHPHFSPIDYEM